MPAAQGQRTHSARTNYPVELSCPCLVCLMGHTAGDDILGELLFIELGKVIAIAADENLGHIQSRSTCIHLLLVGVIIGLQCYTRCTHFAQSKCLAVQEHCQFTKLVTLDEVHFLCFAQQFQCIMELYWSEQSACAALGYWQKRRWPIF